MEDFYKILNQLEFLTKEDVLATIIDVQGSAYRKEGTSMLFKKDGTKTGLISAGCLEEDLSYRTEEIVKNGVPQTFTYNLQAEGDQLWGQGAGCNGVIKVLLEPITGSFTSHLKALKNHLAKGNRVTFIRELQGGNPTSSYLFYSNNGAMFGEWDQPLSHSLKGTISTFHQMNVKSGIHYCSKFSTHLYIHSFKPKPRLIIFGAGQDAIPIASLASKTGFYVIVSDWRPAFCKTNHFPHADQLIVGFPEEILREVSFTIEDSVLLVTHNFEKDREYLQYLTNQELAYLGILGSKNRTKRLFNSEEIPSSVTSPIGLSIGAEGPEEIAVSVIAQLIQLQRSKQRKGVLSIE
ncbi:XdhC family protein [Bacillus sp. AK128]